MLTVQELAATLIRTLEGGVRLRAFQDSGGVWTIGYGHTADVEEDQTCTLQQATDWLAHDSAPLFAMVRDKPLFAAAAYVSFGYNCGKHSLELVLAGKAELLHYVHDRHGNMSIGLANRRDLEQALIDASTP